MSTDGQCPGAPTEAEWAQIREWNSRRIRFDESQCAHHLFEEQAQRTPAATAIVCGAESLTYAELERKANRLAHRLRELGAGLEVFVGMCCERTPDAIVALLAILKAGAAYVPLDPSHPEERLRFLIEDSTAAIVVGQKQFAGRFSGLRSGWLALEDETQALSRMPETPPESGVGARNLAYMIYTSGSTGTPKGVLIEHRNLVNQLLTCGPIWQIRPGARVLQFARFGFDASIWEIGLTLAAGGTLVMAPQTSLMSGRELAALIRDRRVECSFLMVSVLALLDPGETPLLRTIICGGEACPAAIVDRWAPGRRFVNAYGPTETTVCSSAAICAAGEGKPPIGAPLPNTEQWVVDEHGQPVGIGVPGELWIGGMGVARGYHRRPELTAERFVRNPFSLDASAKLYRSGDLVQWRADGQLDYLGRIDSQVKLRGFRVELGEIEAALRQHAGVGDVAVVLRRGAAGDEQLVAYVVSGDK